jgi:hypothetical protein
MKATKIITAIAAAIFLINLASANLLFCLSDGQGLPPGCPQSRSCVYTCNLDSGSGYCQICTTDSGFPGVNPNTCDDMSCNFMGGQNQTADVNPPVLTVITPANGATYPSNRVVFEVNVDTLSRLDYRASDDTSWHKLCDSCKNYKRSVSLEEGPNEITIRAQKLKNNLMTEVTRTFSIDSRAPECQDSLPNDEEFSIGIFDVEYTEENLDQVVLFYKGAFETAWKNKTISGCVPGNRVSCQTYVDLSAYENSQVEYYFNVCDKAACDPCSAKTIHVDSSPPVLTNNLAFKPIYNIKKIPFDLSANEPVDMFYIDNLGNTERERRICSKCQSVNKEFTFPDGNWNISIFARDIAGNLDSFDVSFFVDTKKPRITKTLPTSGFISSEFEVQLQEDNPASLVLYYGNGEKKSLDLNTDCIELNRNKKSCTADLSLASYDNQSITYWFEIIDIANNSAQSRAYTIEVDTTFPVINSIDYTLDGRKAEITLDVTEKNLDEITFMNENSIRPRENTFCSRLTDGKCVKAINLNYGENKITFYAIDKAGNQAAKTLDINV